MALNLSIVEHEELKPRITVFGVGGAGGNAVNNMIEQNLDGVEFVVANTDAQALQQSRSNARIQLGVKVTEGLGAGARPAVGSAAAEETIEEIVDHLAGAHMCFITAGMGGGTGTGAAPIIAQAARELGVLTVGVVTKPFQFEGAKRMRIAEEGIEALQRVVDTLIIIPNQNLFRLANEKTTFTEAFAMADDVLYQGVKGVTDLMVRPGLINLDFADVRSVMDEMGKAMMGTGEASGEDRAIQAAEKAIANPLLDEISLKGAKGVLINITGGYDLTLFELDEAANRIREEVDPDANIIVGSTLDADMDGVMRVSVVATGIDALAASQPAPVTRRAATAPTPTPAPASAQTAARPAIRTEPAPEPEVAPAPAAQAAPQGYERAVPEFEPEFSEPGQPGFFDETAENDDLPAPAYTPSEEAEPVAAKPSDFVAPARRPAGTPTPEAIERLQAAVNRSSQRAGGAGAAIPRAPSADPRAPQTAGDRNRFGINSLLSRMTGHSAEPAPRAAQQPQRPAPTAGQFEDDGDPERDRIEIPAFLRRQAN